MADEVQETARRYREFAGRECRGYAPLYEEIAAGISADPEVLALIDGLPAAKRQPNLILAVVRFLLRTAAFPRSYPEWRAAFLARAEDVLAIARARSTQTNEVGRCAPLLFAFAALPGPLALLELGASGGLCLLPDRYAYDFGGSLQVGDPRSPVRLRCEVRGRGLAVPRAPPRVAWRAGIDLAPVDVRRDEEVAWLSACVWPGQPERLVRLAAAVGVARGDPPRIERGDLVERLPSLASEAPSDALLCVFHSATFMYLSREQKAALDRALVQVSQGRPVAWISNESPDVMERFAWEVGGRLPATMSCVVGLTLLEGDRREERVVGIAHPHGDWIEGLSR